jgi:hypothetical protein
MDGAGSGDTSDRGLQAGADPQWLERLCRRTDDELWRSYRFSLDASASEWPRVVFPAKGRERRVGEQEARFAFVSALLADEQAGDWAFAAECPTRLSYRFAHRGVGEKSQKALVDLALFCRGRAAIDDGCEAATLAVEFKSGGRSGKSEKDESIVKDVAKIVAEQSDALWFHVVRNANSATLEGLLRSVGAAFKIMSNPLKLADYLAVGKSARPLPKTVTFHVCVLNPDMTVSIHRTLDYRPKRVPDDFFLVDTQAARASLEIVDARGWSVYRGSDGTAAGR